MNKLIIILVALFLLYVLVMFLAGRMRKKWSVADKNLFEKNWHRITDMEDRKHAVMEVDKLLDQMLKKRGYEGSLGDKLKKARSIFSDNNSLWEAHKVRNKLAHELNYQLKEAEYTRAMSGFKKAFKDLNLL